MIPETNHAPAENYQEFNHFPVLGPMVFEPVNNYFDNRAQRNIQHFIKSYATAPDGTVNERLAGHIKREITRRNDQSKMLDVWDRVVSSFFKFPVLLLATTSLTMLTGIEKDPKLAMKKSAIAGGVATLIDALWPLVRYEAAMYGGAQTAISMNNLDAKEHANNNSQTWQERVSGSKQSERTIA